MIKQIIKSLPAHIISGQGISKSTSGNIKSFDPYTGEELWSTASADHQLLDETVKISKDSFQDWMLTTIDSRIEIIKNFTLLVEQNREILRTLVSLETGKPTWEANVEVSSLINKLSASTEAYSNRSKETSREVKGLLSRTRFKPHGVMVVLGPYNFPLSMANSHIMPALIAGNTVIFKPSELAPLCGIFVSKLWQEAGIPKGVMNCVTGDGLAGSYLVEHSDINGILLVGSHTAGMSVLHEVAKNPSKIAAVEMGGNSPLIIEDFDPAKTNEIISIIIHSSFISAGQRCSAARRLLINEKNLGLGLLDKLLDVTKELKYGHYTDAVEPFSGPIIRPEAAQRINARFEELKQAGGSSLLDPNISGPNNTIITPGIIDVTQSEHIDEEIFGPVLKLYRYTELDDAIVMANNTKFGLAAGIVTQYRKKFDKFYSKIDAGIINWNQQLTGATTFAPFGGIKNSGNFRPAGFLSSDYCSYGLASFEVESDAIILANTPGISF